MTREEAIEIVKTQYSHDSVMTTALGMLIPELRENEDERIIREMLEYFTVTRQSDFCSHPERQAWIAWLEKQKEQKPISFNESYNPDEYEVVIEGNATSLKRKEQKPVKLNEEDDELRYYIYEAVQTRYSDRELSKYFNPKIICEKRELRRKIFAFLRDLCPSWKPSEEQMNVLRLEIGYLESRPGEHSIAVEMLRDLYNDLKKL